MKITPSYGPPRNQRTFTWAIVAAVLMVVMLVCQLFAYEHFPAALDVLLPINDQPIVHLAAALIVIAELFSLPYLLGMYVASLMRVMSASFAVIVSGFWLLMSLTNAHAANIGLFSTTYDLHGGILPVLWSFVLFGAVFGVIVVDSRFRNIGSS